MSINPRKPLAAVAVAAGAVAVLGAPTASASPSGDLWNLANAKHVAAGCGAYTDNPALGNTALDIAKVMVNPPGGIAGNGRVPTDSMLADKGYYVTSWGEADYINSAGAGSPQAAMDFWLANGTRDIFPNCNNHDMATAVWINNGKWAAVLLAASPGGAAPQAPVVH
jgi:hypothetical protein